MKIVHGIAFARNIILMILIVILLWGIYQVHVFYSEKKVLEKIIERLGAETRIADVVVTDVAYDQALGVERTTIKFLEYDVHGAALEPRFFTFSDNIIQFQSLVIRFDDDLVKKGHILKGKSAYLFWKVFTLHGEKTEEYEITAINQIPDGYRIESEKYVPYEERIWQRFWGYALDSEKANQAGVKNAQIEAPGMLFVPGKIYHIVIEHDGGIRIDAESIPDILQGEMMGRKVEGKR